MDATRLSELIGHIYDCVPDERSWNGLLAELCRAVDGTVGTLSVINPNRRRIRFCGVHGAPSITEPLVNTYAQHMPFFDILQSLEVGHPYLMSDMTSMVGEAGREMLEDTVMYREWNRPNGLTDSFCVSLFGKPDEVVCLNIVLDEERRPVTPDDRALMAMIIPHIRRAALMGTRLEVSQHQATAYRDLLDHMAHSVVVVNKSMRILYANPAAEALLGQRYPIRSMRGHLIASPAAASERIERDVRLSASMEQRLEGASFAIPLGDPDSPSIAHVVPLARRDGERRVEPDAVAAIVIAARGAPVAGRMDVLGELYGLTTAEKRVAEMTVEGMPRATIAENLGVRESTVKSQLESIFSKTGASGQSALIILSRDLAAPLR